MPGPGDLNVVQNLSPQGTPTGVSVSGSTVTISLAAAVNSGDVVTVDYTGTAIKNLAGLPARPSPACPSRSAARRRRRARAPLACVRPLVINSDGTACVPPPPPPPPILFLGTSPADGAILGSVDSITFTANHDASWFAITVTRDGDAPQDLVPGSGASYTSPSRPPTPARTRSPRRWTTATTRASTSTRSSRSSASGIPGDRRPGTRGSVDANDGIGSASWPAKTFNDPVIVRIDAVTSSGACSVRRQPRLPGHRDAAPRRRAGPRPQRRARRPVQERPARRHAVHLRGRDRVDAGAHAARAQPARRPAGRSVPRLEQHRAHPHPAPELLRAPRALATGSPSRWSAPCTSRGASTSTWAHGSRSRRPRWSPPSSTARRATS